MLQLEVLFPFPFVPSQQHKKNLRTACEPLSRKRKETKPKGTGALFGAPSREERKDEREGSEEKKKGKKTDKKM